jgi:hypothetical protein
MWKDFLNTAEGDNVWAAARYSKPKNINSIPTIRDKDDIVAETFEKGVALLANMAYHLLNTRSFRTTKTRRRGIYLGGQKYGSYSEIFPTDKKGT